MVGLYVNLYQLRAFVPIAARAGQAQVIFGRVATGRQRNNVLNFEGHAEYSFLRLAVLATITGARCYQPAYFNRNTCHRVEGFERL